MRGPLRSITWMVGIALVLAVATTLTNTAVAIYHAQTTGNDVLVGLAIARIVASGAVVGLLLVALERLRAAMRMYAEESSFLKEWILRNIDRERSGVLTRLDTVED